MKRWAASHFMLALILIICISPSSVVFAAPTIKEYTLPAFKGFPMRPMISGDWVVTSLNETDKACLSPTKGIICYNLATKETYTLYRGQTSLPSVRDGMAVWCGIKGKLADFVKGQTDFSDEKSNLIIMELGTWKSSTPRLEAGPTMGGSVSDNRLVYVGQDKQVYLLDLITGKQKKTPLSGSKITWPNLYGDILIWTNIAKKHEIHGYNITSEKDFLIASSADDDEYFGGCDGRTVVWTDQKNKVWAQDIVTGETRKIADGEAAVISDGVVAYCRARVAYAMDLRDGKEFRVSSGIIDCAPSISMGRVAWMKSDKIYIAELSFAPDTSQASH